MKFFNTLFRFGFAFLCVMNTMAQDQSCGNYEIIDASKKIQIPFEFYGMNLMVHSKINGIDVKMLIDNGVMWDELWFYGNNQVDSLRLTYLDDVTIVGAGEGEGVQSKTASSVVMNFDNIIFRNQTAIVSPKEQGFADYFPGMAGQLCGTFFKNFIVEFDFDKMLITLHKPNDFKFTGNGFSIPMYPDTSGSYSMPVTLLHSDKEIKKDIFIDLGGIYPLSLVVNTNFPVQSTMEKILLGYGASGPIYGYKGAIDGIRIGEHTIEKPEAVFTEDESGGGHTNFTVGLPLLMNFNLIFDYFNNKLYFIPRK